MNSLDRLLLGGACIVILVAGMRAASSIIAFVLFAGLLAMCISPLVDWLGRKGISRSMALLTTILVVIVGGVILATVLGTSIARLFQVLPTYESRLQELKEAASGFLASLNLDATALLSQEELSATGMIRFALALIGGVLTTVGNSLFLILLVALMLVEIAGYEGRLHAAGNPSNGMTARLFEVRKDIRKFVSITALIGLLIAAGNMLLLLMLGIDFPVLWGVLSFLFNFIPAIGGLLALIPPFLLALLKFGWTEALIVGVGFVLINNIADNVLKPKLMKKGLDISILLIFLSLMFWSWVLGPLGAILAIPLTMLIRRLLMEIAEDERQALV